MQAVWMLNVYMLHFTSTFEVTYVKAILFPCLHPSDHVGVDLHKHGQHEVSTEVQLVSHTTEALVNQSINNIPHKGYKAKIYPELNYNSIL